MKTTASREADTPPRPRIFRSETMAASIGIYLPTFVISRGVGFLRGFLLAWIVVSKSEYGLLQLGLMAISFLYPLASMGMNEAVTRYIPQYEARQGLRAFLPRAVFWALLCSGAMCGIGAIFVRPLGRFLFAQSADESLLLVSYDDVYRLMWVILLCVFLLTTFLLLQAILKGLRMFRAISIVEIGFNVGFTLLVLLFAGLRWNDADAMVGAYGLTLFLLVAAFAPFIYRMFRQQPVPESDVLCREVGHLPIASKMLRFSIWVSLAAFFWQVVQYAPMWFLQKNHGPSVTGTFAAARHIAQAVLVGSAALVNVIIPAINRLWESHSHDEADREFSLIYKCCALFMCVSSAIIALLAGSVMDVFPAEYVDGELILPILLLFFLLCSQLMFMTIHFQLIERTHHLLLAYLVGMIVSAAVGYAMIQAGQSERDALAAAAWLGVSGISAASLICLVLLRLERRPFDRGSVLLLVAGYALVLPAIYLAIGLGLLVVAVVVTPLVFSRDEKTRIHAYRRTGWSGMKRMLFAGNAS